MTVCVAVKVHDRIVFAADSATSLQGMDASGKHAIVNIYDHANKVFNLRKRLPIAAMTAGIGNFGNSSISTIAKDLRALLSREGSDYRIDPDNYTVEEIATKARRYLYEERFLALADKPDAAFDFWIGGYSSGADLGEIWPVHIEGGACGEVICEADRTVPDTICWGGQPDAINRLILGYGQGLSGALLDAGLAPDKLDPFLNHVAARTQVGLANPAMPTKDAIDLAHFLVSTTKGFVRFALGPNVVGGEIDIATVTKHEGFKWISRKHYYPSTFNPLETDHV